MDINILITETNHIRQRQCCALHTDCLQRDEKLRHRDRAPRRPHPRAARARPGDPLLIPRLYLLVTAGSMLCEEHAGSSKGRAARLGWEVCRRAAPPGQKGQRAHPNVNFRVPSSARGTVLQPPVSSVGTPRDYTRNSSGTN